MKSNFLIPSLSTIYLFIIIIYSSPAYSQKYNTGLIPDEISTPHYPEPKTRIEYVDPYADIVSPPHPINKRYNRNSIKDSLEGTGFNKTSDSLQIDPIEASMDSFANAPATQNAPATPPNFDYENTNAERFINSPCYKSIGFNPQASQTEQERQYSECENDKMKKQVITIGCILLILLFLGLLVFLGIKQKR